MYQISGTRCTYGVGKEGAMLRVSILHSCPDTSPSRKWCDPDINMNRVSLCSGTSYAL
jgi:hypothetical protein